MGEGGVARAGKSRSPVIRTKGDQAFAKDRGPHHWSRPRRPNLQKSTGICPSWDCIGKERRDGRRKSPAGAAAAGAKKRPCIGAQGRGQSTGYVLRRGLLRSRTNSERGEWFHGRRKEKPRRSGAEFQMRKTLLRTKPAMQLYRAGTRKSKGGRKSPAFGAGLSKGDSDSNDEAMGRRSPRRSNSAGEQWPN